MSRLVIVTATTNFERARSCIKSWGDVPMVVVINGDRAAPAALPSLGQTDFLVRQEYLGTVPAFKAGVDYALEHTDAEVIACFHDDLELLDAGWAEKVLRRFDQQSAVGLLGFGGAIGLGDADIYQKPYAPVQLARIGFRSNLVDAEVHGVRSLLAERVACLDGFSQVGRREFWTGGIGPGPFYTDGVRFSPPTAAGWTLKPSIDPPARPWDVLDNLGIRHHLYDGLLGCLAARYGWETWYEPIRCRHLGGQTAVGDEGYQRWAQQQTAGGDHGFWKQAHKAGYEAFRDVLPLRV